MTRFDADAESDRRELVADAVRAHQERESPFLTLEADGGEPWVQFSEGVCNLDCSDPELERLKGLLAEFPAFEISELTEPETAEGTNVRVSTRAGPDRVAQFVERVFREVYERQAAFRLWAAAV